MEQYYLGIDNGGTVIKAALYNNKGQELGVHAQTSKVYSPSPGFVEKNLNELIADLQTCIRGVVAATNIAASQIVGISVSCHGKGLYLVGKSGTGISNGIVSSDARAHKITQELKQNGTAEQIYPLTFQQLWTGHPASLLIWLTRHNPRVLEETSYIFMGHDYIRYYLTGESHAEITNMSGSALVDVTRAEYSASILKKLQLEHIKEKLPPLINSIDHCGVVNKQASQETGLCEGTPVFAGFFDVVSSAISSGLTKQDEINATMGTWSISTAITDSIIKADYPYIWGNYCIKDTYFVHEGSPTSASNLEWYITHVLEKKENIFDLVNKQVSEAPHDAELLFFPFLYSSNISDNMPSSLMGLRAHHTQRDILRAIYEGIVFSHKIHLERLYKIVNTKRITLVGGPSKSSIWMQMFADISENEIVIPNCKEAGCKGAALAAMVGNKEYSDFTEAVVNTVSAIQTFHPQPETKNFYRDKYEKYKKAAALLASLH